MFRLHTYHVIADAVGAHHVTTAAVGSAPPASVTHHVTHRVVSALVLSRGRRGGGGGGRGGEGHEAEDEELRKCEDEG